MMTKDRAQRRKDDYFHAKRKKRICNERGHEYYDNLHQYSKNKIHCSCPMCHGEGPLMSDKKRIEEMESQLNEEN